MSAWADASWTNTPSYGIALRNPTFVKEIGYEKEERVGGRSGGGAKGVEVAAWYNEFASSAPLEERVHTFGGDKAYEAPKPPVPALPSRRPPPTIKHKTHRASDPHWFISHSVAASTSSSVIPFSLSASTSDSRPPTSSNLASLLTLPDPGQGPSFVPPPHFHLKPGNRGHDLLVKAGWNGRGLGKGGKVEGAVEGKGKGKEVVAGSDQEKQKRKPKGKQDKVKKEKKLKMKGDAIDLTVSSSDESSSSSSDDDDDDSDSSSSSATPPSSSSSSTPHLLNPNASIDGRFALIAPLSTTLKADRLGIRSAASTARHTAVTHSHKQIRDAQRQGREEEGKWSAKSIRKQAERDRRERLDVMDELRGN